jgi:hypothetical protein
VTGRCWCGRTVSTLPDSNGVDCAEHDGPHTVVDRPDIPLTLGERDRFDDLITLWFSPPPVTTRYYTPRARLRRLAARVARSPFADDLRRYGWLAGLLAAGVLCVAVSVLTRGMYVDWSGWHPIPTTGGTR